MSDLDLKAELFREGLLSYSDAKKATETFQSVVGEIAKKVMMKYLEEFKLITEQPNLLDNNIIIPTLDPMPSKVGCGASISLPGTWGMSWGAYVSTEATICRRW